MTRALRSGLCGLLFLFLAGGVSTGQTRDVETLIRHVEFLTADALAGRLTGEPGEENAANYVANELERIGAQPLPGQDGFLFPFEFTAGSKDAGSVMTLAKGDAEPLRFTGNGSLQALSFSDNGTVSAPVVFAGYGLTTPDLDGFSYDSYAGLDVKDKIVLVLRYVPEDLDPDRRAELSRYAGLRYKAIYAREAGAKAIVVVTGPRSPNAGEVIPMTYDAAIAGSEVVGVSISGEVADRLFEHVDGKTLEEVQQELDDGNPHVTGFEIPGVELTLEVRVEREKRTGHNVIGWLPASPGFASGPSAKEHILLGAHLDHLGKGRPGNSLARANERGMVHRGADDNASGVAAVLLAGEMLAPKAKRRPVVLAFWSGEEIGLLGSSHFTKNPPVPLDQIVAYLNFDMVGRMKDRKLVIKATGSSSRWPGLIEQTNVPFGFDVRLNSDPYQPSDTMSLYLAGVPSLDFFTGAHEDYHRPSDSSEKLDYQALQEIAFFGVMVTRKIAKAAERPDYLKVEAKAPGGARAGLRAFTGTIPDYATEVEGLRLSGVVEGGPAAEAGLREGDVIVEFGGMKIGNIYDYTHALERAQIGEPLEVVVLREGERVEVTITPTARK